MMPFYINPYLFVRFFALFWVLFLAMPSYATDKKDNSKNQGEYTLIKWKNLVPQGWNPATDFQKFNLAEVPDGDPRAIAALEKMRAIWNKAPANTQWANKKIRIVGFAIPLDIGVGINNKEAKVKEWLLVPYFGACIHTPPPPANQIIHALSQKPLSGIETMAPLWVMGTLKIAKGSTEWGASTYQLIVDKIEPFEAEAVQSFRP